MTGSPATSAPRLAPMSLRARLRRRWLHMRGKRGVDFFDIGDGLTMGRHSYNRPAVRWYYGDNASVTIGSFCSLADDVLITVGGRHPTEFVSTFPFRARFRLDGAYIDGIPQAERDVVIGHDVYVGRGARILAGVRIGTGAVVGAYAVVAKDVRPYAIVAGNPAREIRRRFPDDVVDRLLAIAWWEWPDEEIRRAIPLISSPDVEGFLQRYGGERE